MDLLKSKKFIMSVGGVLAVVLGHFLGVPEETTLEIVGIVIAFVLGQGIADAGKEAAKAKAAKKK